MTFTDTFDPRCCSICSGGWYLMCPSSTNMQRCLSRFLSDFLLYWLEENLMNKQQYIVYTNNLPKCLKFSSSTHLKDCERVHIVLILTQLCFPLWFNCFSCWLITMSAVGSTTACLTDGLISGWPQRRSYIFLVNSFGESLNLWHTR